MEKKVKNTEWKKIEMGGVLTIGDVAKDVSLVKKLCSSKVKMVLDDGEKARFSFMNDSFDVTDDGSIVFHCSKLIPDGDGAKKITMQKIKDSVVRSVGFDFHMYKDIQEPVLSELFFCMDGNFSVVSIPDEVLQDIDVRVSCWS